MSYINKPGKTSAAQKMIIRRQASDVIAYHQIQTTITKAKATQKRVDRLVTWAKANTVASRRLAARWLVDNQKGTADALLKHLFAKIGPAFKDRAGGYTRVLKLGKRVGDATEMAVLQFVQRIAPYSAPKKVKSAGSKSKTAVASSKPNAQGAAKQDSSVQAAGSKTVELLQHAENKTPELAPAKPEKATK